MILHLLTQCVKCIFDNKILFNKLPTHVAFHLIVKTKPPNCDKGGICKMHI
jgi:hypothetical protein